MAQLTWWLSWDQIQGLLMLSQGYFHPTTLPTPRISHATSHQAAIPWSSFCAFLYLFRIHGRVASWGPNHLEKITLPPCFSICKITLIRLPSQIWRADEGREFKRKYFKPCYVLSLSLRTACKWQIQDSDVPGSDCSAYALGTTFLLFRGCFTK